MPPAFLSKLAPVTLRGGGFGVALGHRIGGRSLGTCISKFQLSALFLLHKIKDATLSSESRRNFLSSVLKKKNLNFLKKAIFPLELTPTVNVQGCVR